MATKIDDLATCFTYIYQAVSKDCEPPTTSRADADLYARRIGHGLAAVIASLAQYIHNDHVKWDDRAAIVKDLSSVLLAGAGGAAPAGAAAVFTLGNVIVGRAVDHYLKSTLDSTFPSKVGGLIELHATVHRKGLTDDERQAENEASTAFATALSAALRALPIEGP